MKRKPESVAAAAFIAVLAVCLVMALSGGVRRLLGDRTVDIYLYHPGEDGITYLSVVDWFKDTCEKLCTDELPGRVKLKEANAAVNRLLGKWIFEGTEMVRLNNGYLAQVAVVDYEKVSPETRVIPFRDFVEEELGVPYLYIQAPCKLCQEDPQLPMAEMDNFNEQTTMLLDKLREAGVDVLDLRRSLHEDGLDHYGCFYVTDHHWTAPTGLWAARVMAEELNERYGLGLDSGRLAEERFTQRVWEDVFLGSLGRKASLSAAQPEDFVLPVPLEPVHVTMTRYGEEITGGFEVLYDEEAITPEDYYGGSSYGALLRGDCGYLKVENLDYPEGPVVAVLRESFAGAPGPYLSLAAGELHLLDARYYDGSVKEKLAEIQPDVVVSLLNVECYVHAYFDEVR